MRQGKRPRVEGCWWSRLRWDANFLAESFLHDPSLRRVVCFFRFDDFP